jgi:hypothetical protein
MSELEQAIADVRQGRAQRICAPAQWVVWSDADVTLFEVMS